MPSRHDLIIAGATVFDGTGAPPRRADVAVKDGRISGIGKDLGAAEEIRDASGLALCPGIIDAHTHYDAQLTWDATASPSVALGVTTVVAGNCGFGIAPCPAAMRPLMLENLAVVEGIELSVLQAGMKWEFESFAEYLDQLRRSGVVPNVAVFVGHTPIRVSVMGEDAARRPATDAEIEAMATLLRESMAAGAIGYATSISANHTGFKGLPVPSRLAEPKEHEALLRVMSEFDHGIVGTVGQQQGPADFERMSELSGRRPLVFNAALYSEAHPHKAQAYVDGCHAAHARGHELYALVSDLPLAQDFRLENAFPLYANPGWAMVRHLSGADLRRGLADPAFRKAFGEALKAPTSNMIFQGDWREIEVTLPATETHRHLQGMNIAELAAREGKDPLDYFFDLGIAEDLKTVFTSYSVNGNEDGVQPLITHPGGLVSASDAGAHVEFMCNAHFGLYLMGHWVRDRKALSLTEAVRLLTSLPADVFRIEGRGRIEEGAHADLLLFDPETIGAGPKKYVSDLPAGGSRMVRDPIGVAGVWVNGRLVFDGAGYVHHARPPGMVLDRFRN